MPDDHRTTLHDYLRVARETLLWKLDGLDEYDVRRPMTPTATNLLGIVKHLAGVTAGYFGDTFGRPFPEPLPWFDDSADSNADFLVLPGESRDYIVGLYQRAWSHADDTITSLSLDAEGHVPWWPDERNPVTLQRVMVHMLAEMNRHCGHADIVRELIDGRAGLRAGVSNLPTDDSAFWRDFHARVDAAAREAGGR